MEVFNYFILVHSLYIFRDTTAYKLNPSATTEVSKQNEPCSQDHFKNSAQICERKRNYGEFCNDNTHCASVVNIYLPWGRAIQEKPYFVCNNGTCGCNSEIAVEHHDESFFSIRTCRIRVGKTCDPQDDKCLYDALCTQDDGDISYRCKCFFTKYETENGTCADKKGYGETCKLDKECDESLGLLSCHPSEKLCTCQNGTSKHPDKSGRCAISAKQSEHICRYDSQCVPNAKCDDYDTKCSCISNTVTSPNQENGYCFVRKGDSCFGDLSSPITNRTCLPGLVCENDTCSCIYPNHQEYSEKEEKCTTLINGPCNESSDCTDNSECIDDKGLKVCRCGKGFTAVDRKCDLAFGESCVQGQSYPKCDRLGPLQCSKNSKCECSRLQVYDIKELKCRGLDGAKCELSKDSFCVEGAECKGFRTLDGKWGICRCLPGMIHENDGRCGSGTSMEIEKQA